MPIKLEVSYSKKLGLPRYSSHSHSISVTMQVPDLKTAEREAAKLYQSLQEQVDDHLRQVGYLGQEEYNGHAVPILDVTDTAALERGKAQLEEMMRRVTGWRCTEPQRATILNLVDEYNLEKGDVEHLAKEKHGVGVRGLDPDQADDFIRSLMQRQESRGSA